jgi:hypothetical protein
VQSGEISSAAALAMAREILEKVNIETRNNKGQTILEYAYSVSPN